MCLKCNYCVNTEQCSTCDKTWKDKFIPSEEVKKYFNHGYVGVRGINGFTWDFDSTNESLKSTHFIIIGNTYYCPYCGDTMYPIQDGETLDIIGHCCICQGARDEIEYEKKAKELEEIHRKEIQNLRKEYEDKLTFCSEKLFDIKQQQEKDSFNFFSHEYNHFSTLNGKIYNEIEQLVR